MSFVLHVWVPSSTELPCESPADARRCVKALLRKQGAAPDPVFLAFGQAMHDRFPDDDDAVWLDGSECGDTTQAVLGFGLRRGHADFFAAYYHAVVQANRLGMHCWDGSAGLLFLADGRTVPADEDGDARVAMDAWYRADWPVAHAEFRRLAANGNRVALNNLGRLYGESRGCGAHRPLGAALRVLGASSPDSHRAAEKLVRTLSEADEAASPALVARLRAGPLLQVIDAVLAEQALEWEAVQREMAGPVDRRAGISRLIALAATGHALAAHWVAVACAKGERTQYNYRHCVGFTELAGRRGHLPSKSIVSDLAGLPEGTMREYAFAERCLIVAQARGEAGIDEALQRVRSLQQVLVDQ